MPFVDKLVARVSALRQGTSEENIDIGSMSSSAQLDTVERQVADALANDSRYGLSASVWSRDKRGGFNIARCIQSGAVCVNDHMIHMLVPELPMGSVKESGITQYCHRQTIVVDRLGLKREPFWYPARSKARLRRTLNALFHSSWRAKLSR